MLLIVVYLDVLHIIDNCFKSERLASNSPSKAISSTFRGWQDSGVQLSFPPPVQGQPGPVPHVFHPLSPKNSWNFLWLHVPVNYPFLLMLTIPFRHPFPIFSTYSKLRNVGKIRFSFSSSGWFRFGRFFCQRKLRDPYYQ